MTSTTDGGDTHDANLERVYGSIADIAFEFCALRWPHHAQFRMNDLSAFVAQRSSITRDSASRILRKLRLRGRIDYRVVSRRDSLYELTAVHVAS